MELLELDPQSRVQLYVIDSQRPLDLDNVYNQDNIHVVMRERDQLDVPAFDDIYSSYLVRIEGCILCVFCCTELSVLCC